MIEEFGFSPTPMKAIRDKCIECSGTWKVISLCDIIGCPLWAYRMGTKPRESAMQVAILDVEGNQTGSVRADEYLRGKEGE